MLVAVFEIMGIAHSEVISQGQTANQTYYEEMQTRLRTAVRPKTPETQTHLIQRYQALCNKIIYSLTGKPHLFTAYAANDCCSFQKFSVHLEGTNFLDIENTRENLTAAVQVTTKEYFR